MNRIDKTVNLSFQQKSTGLSLIVVVAATIYYFANMWPMRPIALANDAIPTGYGNLVLSTRLCRKRYWLLVPGVHLSPPRIKGLLRTRPAATLMPYSHWVFLLRLAPFSWKN